MRRRFHELMLALLALFLLCSLAYGQTEQGRVKIIDQINKSQRQQRLRTHDENKMLYGVYETLRDAEIADSLSKAGLPNDRGTEHYALLRRDVDGRVVVVVEFSSLEETEKVKSIVVREGGVVELAGQRVPFVRCRIAPLKLRSLASLPFVRSIRPSFPAVRNNDIDNGSVGER